MAGCYGARPLTSPLLAASTILSKFRLDSVVNYGYCTQIREHDGSDFILCNISIFGEFVE